MRERDVEDAGAADWAKETHERRRRSSEEAWHALRDRLLSKHCSFLAFWRVSLSSHSFSLSFSTTISIYIPFQLPPP